MLLLFIFGGIFFSLLFLRLICFDCYVVLSEKQSLKNMPKHNIKIKLVILRANVHLASCLVSLTSRGLGLFSGTSPASGKSALATQECEGLHQVVNGDRAKIVDPKLDRGRETQQSQEYTLANLLLTHRLSNNLSK